MNVVASIPILILSGAACVALLLGLLPDRRLRRAGPSLVGGVGVVGALVATVLLWGDREIAYTGNLYVDRFALIVGIIVLVATGATLALSVREPSTVDRRGEFVALLLLSATGMLLAAGAGDIIVVFLGIELLSVALYILCALEVWRTRSLEAGLKYLIVGAVGSAILLYGLALLYGATGATRLSEIAAALEGTTLASDTMVTAAMAMIVAGLAFKASAVPFHMWTPDVYQGAPTPVTAFMATATKATAIAVFLRILYGTLPEAAPDWKIAVAVLAAATVIVGNVAALVQTNVKRILAYSGVAQAGYLLIGVAAGSIGGAKAALYYLIAYLAMTLAAFAVVVIREREVADGDELHAFSGVGRSRPLLGIVMTLALLSLAGIPPLSGFLAKLLVFREAVDADLAWLAVVGAVGSVIGLVYYLRLASVMWFGDETPARRRLRPQTAVLAVAVMSAVAIVGLAAAAGPVLDMCRGAAEALIAP